MKLFGKLSAAFSFLAIFLAFTFSADSLQAQDSVVDVINNSDDHTVFASLLDETDLADAISDQGPYTIIAPTDQAFEQMGEELEQLKQNPDMLQNVVVGHLFHGEVAAEEAEPALGINIVNGDIEASNGLVHVSDEVIQ